MTEVNSEVFAQDTGYFDARKAGKTLLPLFVESPQPTARESEIIGDPVPWEELKSTGADVFITTRCHGAGDENHDLLCKYCIFSVDDLKNESVMSRRTYKRILTALLPSNVDTISILGGEPSLHPRVEEFIKLTHEMGYHLRFVTNGCKQA